MSQTAFTTVHTLVPTSVGEWMPDRHHLYPLPFDAAVRAVVAMWSWNTAANAPWHPEANFWTLPLEVVYVVFEWMGAEIGAVGYHVLP